jgi:hypothetical protein
MLKVSLSDPCRLERAFGNPRMILTLFIRVDDPAAALAALEAARHTVDAHHPETPES